MEASPTSIVSNSNSKDAQIKRLEETNANLRFALHLSRAKSNSVDEPVMSPVQQFYGFESDENDVPELQVLQNKITLLQNKLDEQDTELNNAHQDVIILENKLKKQSVEMESDYLVVRKLKEEKRVLEGDLKAREDGNLALSRMIKALKGDISELKQRSTKSEHDNQLEIVRQIQGNLEELRRGQEKQNALVAKFKDDSSVLQQELKAQSEVIETMKTFTATINESPNQHGVENAEQSTPFRFTPLHRTMGDQGAAGPGGGDVPTEEEVAPVLQKMLREEVLGEMTLRKIMSSLCSHFDVALEDLSVRKKYVRAAIEAFLESDYKPDIEVELELDKHEELVKKLTGEKSALESKVKEMEGNIQTLREEKSSQHRKMDDAVKSLEEENSELKTKQKTILDNMTALQLEVESLKEQSEDILDTKEDEKPVMEDEIKLLQKENELSNKREESLMEKFSELEKENRMLETQNSNLEEVNVGLQEEKDVQTHGMVESLAAMEAQLDEKETEIRKMEEEIVTLKNAFLSAKKAKEVLNQIHGKLEEDHRLLQDGYAKMQSEKSHSRNELSDVKEKLKSLQNEHILLQEAMADLEANRPSKFAANEEIERLEDYNKQLRNDNSTLLSQNNYLNEKMDDLNSKIREKDYDVNRLADELVVLKRCHAELRKCVRKLTGQLSTYMNRVNYTLNIVKGEVVIAREPVVDL